MLLIIAKRNDEVARFVFPVQHDLDVPIALSQAKRMLDEKGWTVGILLSGILTKTGNSHETCHRPTVMPSPRRA